MRVGKTRKELYLSRSDTEAVKALQVLTGLDRTNAIRMAIHYTAAHLAPSPHIVANDAGLNTKPACHRPTTGTSNAE